MLRNSDSTSHLYPTEEIAFQLSDSSAQMVVCDGALEPFVRQALQIMKKDLPLMCIGAKKPNNLPRVADVLTDTNMGFADLAQVILCNIVVTKSR